MRRDRERRLQALEAVAVQTSAGELWIELDGGMLRGPQGETVSKKTFEATSFGPGPILILPDNGRDRRSGDAKST